MINWIHLRVGSLCSRPLLLISTCVLEQLKDLDGFYGKTREHDITIMYSAGYTVKALAPLC